MIKNTVRIALVLLLVLMLAPLGHAQSSAETVAYSFCSLSLCTDGENPITHVIQGSDGNFYGTAKYGGQNGFGTAFQLTSSGTLTVLYAFCGQTSCADGSYPGSGLVESSTAGTFYGVTTNGGANNHGSLYQVTSGGVYTVLYSFCALTNCTDGANPAGNLVVGSDGTIYGITTAGGNSVGTLYKFAGGQLTTLHTFCASGPCSDGTDPLGGLSLINGALYGTTERGGANGQGTIFKSTTAGTLTTLYSFCAETNCTDGSQPQSTVIGDDYGNLFGTTNSGGANASGTVFKVDSKGNFTALYSFCSQTSCTDGSFPEAGLALGSDGALYGTTDSGGANATTCSGAGCGSVFQITTDGALTTLYSFCSLTNCPDGSHPDAALIQAGNGSFYGTTSYGGAHDGGGVVYAVTVPDYTRKAPTILLTGSPAKPSVGQTVTLTAAVTGAEGMPGGTVSFAVGSMTLSTVAVSTGTAMFSASTNGIVPGNYPVTATYNGDSTYHAATSPAFTVALVKAPTKTTLTASPNPATPPAKVTLTATVKRSASGATGVPSGKVTFYSGTLALGSATLNGSGVATYAASTNGAPAGSYPVTAKFTGGSYDAASTSPAVSVQVK